MSPETIHKRVKIAHIFYGIMMGVLSVFGIIFFYIEFEESIFRTFMFLGIIYVICGIVDLFISRVVNIISSRVGGVVGMSFFWLSFLFLYLFSVDSESKYLILYAISYILARSLYRNVFQNYLMETSHVKTLGHDLGGLLAVMSLASIAVPLFVGYLSDEYGTISLVIMMLFVSITSIIIYATIPNIEYKTHIRLKDLKEDRTYRGIINASFWAGFSAPGTWVWSIMLFISLGGAFEKLGLFIAVVNLIAVVGMKIIGNKMDGINKSKLFTRFTFTNGIEFLIKGLSFNYIILVIADLFGRFNDKLYGVVYNTYSSSWVDHHEQRELIDERVAVGQSSFNLSVGASFLLVAILSLVMSLHMTLLVFGAIMIAGYMFSQRSQSKKNNLKN